MISGTMVVEESMQLLCRQGDWCVPYNVVYGENPPPPILPYCSDLLHKVFIRKMKMKNL